MKRHERRSWLWRPLIAVRILPGGAIRFGLLWLLLLAIGVLPTWAVPSGCDVCGGSFNGSAVTMTDAVDHSKKWVCLDCADLPTVCYHCGIPVRKDYITMSDGRVLCRRDRVGIVLDEAEALDVCRDVDRTLITLLGRFTEFPSTNVQVRLADRVDVRALLGVAGNDFSCPNVLGYTLSLQKQGYQLHDIRVLTGLQKGVLQATYAHELGHAWISENLSKSREIELKGDAAEGFCELLGYLVARAYRDEIAQSHVVGNDYTRGQMILFIEAERQFGLVDVIDWMQYGRTRRLVAGQLAEIRDVDLPAAAPRKAVSEILFIPRTPAKAPESLELTSITLGPRLSIATINGRTFELNEQRKVPLGSSNVVIRCLSIGTNEVVVEHAAGGNQERLQLRSSLKTAAPQAPPAGPEQPRRQP